MASVKAQRCPTDHILVADGHPSDAVCTAAAADEHVRHIILDQNTKNWGNTPRAIGALLAIAADYEMIGFLDADNQILPHHIDNALAHADAAPQDAPLDLIFARRRLVRPDGSDMGLIDTVSDTFVDANCYLFLPGAFHTIPWWGTVPTPMACGADRVFRAYLTQFPRLNFAALDDPSVLYECQWAGAYRAIGETPPKGAKDSASKEAFDWLTSLTQREHEIAERRTGVRLTGRPKN